MKGFENNLKFRIMVRRKADGQLDKIVHTMEELQKASMKRIIAYQFGVGHVLVAQNMFSGVEDCDGVSIYEGDIIECQIYEGSKSTHNAVVRLGEYKQDGSGGEYSPVSCLGFYADAINPDGLDDDGYRNIYDFDVTTSLLYFHRIKIIGNIYQNPELIKEQAK